MALDIRSTVRITGAAKNTVTKLVVELGQACADYQDKTLRDLPANAFCVMKSGLSVM
jgi:hypothetical protein